MIQEPEELYTAHSPSTLLQVDVLRAMCQHSSEQADKESTLHWVFAYPELNDPAQLQTEEEDNNTTVVHTVVADFRLLDAGWVLAVTVRAKFFSSEKQDFSDTKATKEFAVKNALWANQAMWDYARATLRSLLAHIPSADETLALPLRAPKPEIIPPKSTKNS